MNLHAGANQTSSDERLAKFILSRAPNDSGGRQRLLHGWWSRTLTKNHSQIRDFAVDLGFNLLNLAVSWDWDSRSRNGRSERLPAAFWRSLWPQFGCFLLSGCRSMSSSVAELFVASLLVARQIKLVVRLSAAPEGRMGQKPAKVRIPAMLRCQFALFDWLFVLVRLSGLVLTRPRAPFGTFMARCSCLSWGQWSLSRIRPSLTVDGRRQETQEDPRIIKWSSASPNHRAWPIKLSAFGLLSDGRNEFRPA